MISPFYDFLLFSMCQSLHVAVNKSTLRGKKLSKQFLFTFLTFSVPNDCQLQNENNFLSMEHELI